MKNFILQEELPPDSTLFLGYSIQSLKMSISTNIHIHQVNLIVLSIKIQL